MRNERGRLRNLRIYSDSEVRYEAIYRKRNRSYAESGIAGERHNSIHSNYVYIGNERLEFVDRINFIDVSG